jgi:hypothetical protein
MRRADLLDPAGAQNRDTIAQRQRFLLIMGNSKKS